MTEFDRGKMEQMENEMFELTSEYSQKVMEAFKKYGVRRVIAGVSVFDLPLKTHTGQAIALPHRTYINPNIFESLLKKSLYPLFSSFSQIWQDRANEFKGDVDGFGIIADGSDKVQ